MRTSYFQVESELSELPSEERFEYLKSLGVSESGLGNLIRATYNLLGLRTYFTSGEKVGFWTIILVFVLQCLYSLRYCLWGLYRKQKPGPYLQVCFNSAKLRKLTDIDPSMRVLRVLKEDF